MAEVSYEMLLLIAARQWLQVLVDKFEIDPETTEIEVASVDKDGRKVMGKVKLADTLAQIDKLTVTVVTKADNDPVKQGQVLVVRKAVLMEDEGREELVGTFPSREAAQAWIDAQKGEYHGPGDYYIAEGANDD